MLNAVLPFYRLSVCYIDASFEIQNGVEAAAFIKVDINSMTIGSRQFMKISVSEPA